MTRHLPKPPPADTHLPQLLGAAARLDGEALEHEEQAAAVNEEAQRGGNADERQEHAAGDAARLHQTPVREHAERPQSHLLQRGTCGMRPLSRSVLDSLDDVLSNMQQICTT